MDIVNIILSAAKAAHVSGVLLLAICQHESNGFTVNYAHNDHGSPSFGSCQIKKATAEFLGFKGSPKELNDPWTNARYSALYLKYQESRYGNDWVKLTAAFNSGTYHESSVVVGCPRNLGYINKVKKKLPVGLQSRLNCGEVARNK